MKVRTELPAEATGVPTARVWLPGTAFGVVGVVVVAVTRPGFALIAAVPIIGAAMVAVIDQRTATIPTADALRLAVASMVAVVVGLATDVADGTAASVLAGAAIWTLPLFFAALTGSSGGGDFKFAFSLGLLTGCVSITAATLGFLLAVLVAAAVALATAVRHRTRSAAVRLGVPLWIGAISALLIGSR